MNNILWILGGIIAVVIIFFFIGLLVATKVSNSKSKKKLNEIYESSPFREKNNPKPKSTNDFKARDERKEIVTGKAVSKEYEKFRQKEEQFKDGLVEVEKEKEGPSQDTVIVDLAKPVGFWSRLIMSQKLGFLMALRQQMNKGNKHGYFVNLIKAQSRSQSKEKGRGL